MPELPVLSRTDARRIAVRAQLLDAPRPVGLAEVVDHLTLLQVDQTSYVAPSADLVCWSRLGRSFVAGHLAAAVEDRELIELRGFLRPAADLALYFAQLRAWPGADAVGWRAANARWVEANARARDEILQQLRSEGPLPGRDLAADFVRDWRSSGWNNNKNVAMMLELLEAAGQVAVSHREGRERFWDLADRIFPDLPAVPLDEARQIRAERRLAALGLARAKGAECPVEPNDVGEVGQQVRIDGVGGVWRVDLRYLDGGFRGRTALLSPLDRLIFDRKRMEELFDFDYALEMFKPAAVRKWGYYALPVLHGDSLVGKIDAEADHRGGFLRVHAIHRDRPWSAALVDAVDAQLCDLGRLLGLEGEVEVEWLPRP